MIEDELAGAADLHAGKRRRLLIFGGNLLLLLTMLGGPWLRGYFRTRALWRAFGEYGACLYGGKLAVEPGLGMPTGHEAHFATRALLEPGFAAACDEQLEALAPSEAIFVLPTLKTAESDLRAAVQLVRQELLPLPARAPGTRLSTRPLRALERLRAGLANHTNASGIVTVPQRDAFVLPGGAHVLPTPTRLPLYAGANAQVSLWAAGDALHALASDATGLSYLRVRGGKLEQTRAPRPKLLEGATPRTEPNTLVWAMSRARCAERAQGCADKTAGIAPLQVPLEALPLPRWLGGHPRGRIDRSVYRADRRVLIAAQASDGRTELREFGLESELPPQPASELPPLAPTRTWPERAAGEPLIVEAFGAPRVLVAASVDGSASLRELTAEGSAPLLELPGSSGPAWAVGCADEQALQVALGHERALLLAARSEAGELRRWEPVAVELSDVIHELYPARDRVLPLCGLRARASVLVHDRAGQLLLISCSHDAARCSTERLAGAVRSFAALSFQQRLIVAYAGEGEASQVRVRSVQAGGREPSEERVPAVCWSDETGLCGPPLLARVGERALLGTREGTDLRVLESDDSGLTWRTLPDLNQPSR